MEGILLSLSMWLLVLLEYRSLATVWEFLKASEYMHPIELMDSI